MKRLMRSHLQNASATSSPGRALELGRDGTADADGDRAFAAVDGSPARWRRHGVEVLPRGAVAGRAGAVREVELDLPAVRPLGGERHLGETVSRGRPRTRPHRVLADKGDPARANPA